jgi:hypothetical protein
MKWTKEMGSGDMIYVQSFVKIGEGIQAILRFRLSNLNDCNIRITYGRGLRIMPLKMAQVAWYTYQVS